VIPHHYDLFKFNTADVREFEREANEIAQPLYNLRIGEKTIR